MTIQWYPGHMAKAKRQFADRLPLVDIVFELRDARVPASSENPDIDQVIGDKDRLLVLMKKDLADPDLLQQWLDVYKSKNRSVLAINAHDPKEWKKIVKLARQTIKDSRQKRKEKGLQDRAIRAVVVGVPNVGKSTLINRLAGRKAAKAANTPGVTQQQQWIKYGRELEMLDTPGMLWPKFDQEDIAYRLALSGAIPDRLLHMDDIALYAIDLLQEHYPHALQDRYKLTDLEMTQDRVNLLMTITQKRGFREDYERGSTMLVTEIRKGILGPMTFDRPEEDLWEDHHGSSLS